VLARFCPRCGAALETEAQRGQKGGSERQPRRLRAQSKGTSSAKAQGNGPEELLSWEKEIRLYADPFIFKGFAVALVLCVVLMQLVVAIMSVIFGERPIYLPTQVCLLTAGILAGLLLLAVLMLRRYTMRYAITSRGISFAVGERERRISRALLPLAFLSGNLQAIGAGLLAVAGEAGSVDWRSVYSFKVQRA